MKLKLVAVTAAVLVVATGAAMAMPGAAPDHAQDGNAQADDRANGTDAENATDADDDSDAARGPPADAPGADAANAASGSQGPPADLPAQVPDFVGDIHEAVGDHVDGAMDGAQSLGDRISDLTPGGDDGGTQTATPGGDA